LSIGGYIDYQSDAYGLDTYEKCLNKGFFLQYPHQISYNFNELGYRERAITDYQKNSIICIGDSFTVGLGLPVELTYPRQLEQLLQYPVLNFGLDGASNQWIKRKLGVILKYFTPPTIIVHYTFTHRREHDRPDWFDNERTLSDVGMSVHDDLNVWQDCYQFIDSLNIPTVHSCIPQWHQAGSVPSSVVTVKQVDFARDYFYYGEKTCQLLAENFASKISSMGALLP